MMDDRFKESLVCGMLEITVFRIYEESAKVEVTDLLETFNIG